MGSRSDDEEDEDRIVGGKKVRYVIPWQVSVRSCNSGQCHFCGGTVLDEWTVLSAAHCFPNGVTGMSVFAGHRNRLSNRKWIQVSIFVGFKGTYLTFIFYFR